MTIRIGLIGARGYVGRDVLSLIAAHPDCELAYASSREWAGRPVREAAEAIDTDLEFEALGPDAAAAREVDAVILGLPNGKSAPFVEAIAAAREETCLIDLSGDHRAAEGWVYGLPELARPPIEGARRIANPGCYATAAQLALAPVAPFIDGPATVFGVSGWSGAGTTPSRKNDPDALKDNIQPYGLIGHGHEAEIARGAGLDVRFHPSVADYFRGLVVVVSAGLKPGADRAAINATYQDRYADEAFVVYSDDVAEPAAVADTHLCRVGGLAISPQSDRFVVTAALDNLLKGAASQAMQNLNLAFGLHEATGLAPRP